MSAGLPEGWAAASVGQLFDCWGGMTPSTANSSYWNGTIPWVSSKDVKGWYVGEGTEFVTKLALRETRLRECRPGTVLVVVRSGILAHTLPVSVTTSPVVINQDLKALDSGDEALNRWLALYLRAHEREILGANRKDGTTVQSVRVSELLDRQLPVAPLAEQRRIVQKVEALLARVHAARDHLEKVPAILKRFRQAVLAAACSGRLTEEWRVLYASAPHAREWLSTSRLERRDAWMKGSPRKLRAYKEPEVVQEDGDLPQGWAWAAGRELFLWSSGAFLPQKRMEAGNVPVYGGNGVSGYHSESLVSSATLVIGRVGAQCGNVHLTNGPAWITDNAIYASWAATGMNLRFSQLVLLGKNLNGHSGGTGQPYVSQELLDCQVFPCPPQAEQQEILRRVEALLALADAIERRVDEGAVRVGRMTQAILARVFLGELVPTEAELARQEGREYEPASALLERVRRQREEEASAEMDGSNTRSGRRGRHGRGRAAATSRRS